MARAERASAAAGCAVEASVGKARQVTAERGSTGLLGCGKYARCVSESLLSSPPGEDGKDTGSASWRAFGTAGARLLILALGAITSVVISRTLGPSGRGAYYVVITVATTAMTLGQLSIEHAHVYLWSQRASRRSLAANAVVLAGANGIVVAGVAWIAVQAARGTVPDGDQDALVAALVGVPLGLLVVYAGGLLLLDGRVARFNVGKLLGGGLQCILLIVLALAGQMTVGAVVTLWVLGTALPLVVFLPSLSPRLRDLSWPAARLALSVGLRYHAGMAALFLLWRVDIFLLNSRVSTADLGLYSLAVTLAEMTYLLTDSVASAVLPRQVTLSLQESSVFTARVVRINLVIATLVIASLSIVMPVAVPLIFGGPYRGTVSPLLLLGPGIVALATARTVMPYLVRLNRPWLVSALAVCALVANVGINLLLIPPLGIQGASLASTVAYGVLAVCCLGWLVRSSTVTWREVVPRLADLRDPIVAVARRLPVSRLSTPT